VGDGVLQHLLDMLQLIEAIMLGVIDAVVDHPKLIDIGVDIHAGDNAYAAESGPFRGHHVLHIPAPLLINRFDIARKIMVSYRVIEQQVTFGGCDHLRFDLIPDHPARDSVTLQIASHGIMTQKFFMIGEIRAGIVDLRADQKLAVVHPRDYGHAPYCLPFFIFA